MNEPTTSAGARRPGPIRWLLTELTKLRLAVWLFIVMVVTMIIGSVFPQGYDAATYVESWGEAKHAALAKWGLLNLFHTKYFLILGAVLFANLIACSVVRWLGRGGSGPAAGEAPAHARPIALPPGGDAARRASDILAARGYKVLGSGGNVVSARRGPWPEGVSLLYHLSLALAITGFILSALFAFEGEVTIAPGETVSVTTASPRTSANALAEKLATLSLGGWRPFAGAPADTTKWGNRRVTLTLNEFITEWEVYRGEYYNKDWISDLSVTGESGATRRTLVEVNRPLRMGGLTFYQAAFDQWFDVVVRRDGVEIERTEGQAYTPFTLESVDGTFFPGALRVGTLFEKHRDSLPIVPHVPLKWQASDAPEDAKPEEIGNLWARDALMREGLALTLENPREATILSYRHDPGVQLLYIAIVAFIMGLAIRTYWPSYRVSLWIEQGPAGTTGRLLLRATGLLGEPEEVEADLAREFEAGG
jgi:cytochrome c biogenesis protein ResB